MDATRPGWARPNRNRSSPRGWDTAVEDHHVSGLAGHGGTDTVIFHGTGTGAVVRSGPNPRLRPSRKGTRLSWCPPSRTGRTVGAEYVEQAARQHLENSSSRIGHGVRPATTVPPTVLMTELDDGMLMLQGRPDGPRVWLKPAEAIPLRYELARAFGSSAAFATRNDEGDAP